MRYWAGPFVWDLMMGGAWRPPAGALATLDLRSPVECGQTVTSSGRALFVTANTTNLGANYTNLGTDPTAVLSGAQKASWQSLFGLPNALSALTLQEALWETLTIQADPTGLDRCHPIIPSGREFQLWLGGNLAFSRRFASDAPEWAPSIDLLKRVYRQVRQETLDGVHPPLHYRKVLGYWVRKYGLPYRNFQPADLPDEADIEPTTTYSENFDGTDGDVIGNLLTWTETSGDFDRASNKVVLTTNDGTERDARAEHDLSSADHYVQAVIGSVAGLDVGMGPACRFSASARTFYYCYPYGIGTPKIWLYKKVSGAITQLGNTAVTYALPESYKVEANGSTIKAYQSGTERLSVTDTAITGNLRGGIWGYRNAASSATLDNWSAADLAAGILYPQLERFHTRGMFRGMRA